MKYLLLLLLSTQALADVTYTNTIKAVFKNRCSRCHDYLPDKNWQDYDIAYAKRALIKEKMIDKTMPQGDDSMPQSERDTVVGWVNAGAPK